MADIGVLNQGWKWLLKESLWCSVAARKTACGFRDTTGVFIRQHWPTVCYGFGRLSKLLCFLMIRWKDCFFRGCRSLFGLGTAALLVIIWSCFLSLTSMSCLLYLLLGMGTAGCAVCYLGFTPGLLIVGLFTLLVLRSYVNFLIVGPLFIVGGFLFSLNHIRLVVLVATIYALYHVKHQAGWFGVLVSINLAFLSCDALICMLQSCDNPSEKIQFEEQKVPESFVEDVFSKENKFSVPSEEFEQVESCKSSSKPAATSNLMNKQKNASTISIPVFFLNPRPSSSDMFLGILVYESDILLLSSAILKPVSFSPLTCILIPSCQAMLVHPDKNMGSPLASESFKKVQCAYEVLSDSMKKRDYDELLRNEELKSLYHKSASTSCQEESTNYYSEESRRIQCTKCGLSHIWICTNRAKSMARWCQDCGQYHQAGDGDGWVEYKGSLTSDQPQKVEIPRAFVCAQSKIFDVSEWAICQGMACRPNTHRPSFHVNMVGLEKTQRCNSSRYPWDLDAEMIDEEEEFDLWLQQAVASGFFCETSKRRKSWSRFKLSPKKVKKQWTRMSRWSH